ncbi:MAG: outer membrane protein transport protein [Thermoanaerobaculia bacterium]|nr:outer membrane protein transport protein [Thermoanaerobaculia bacterium]
MIVRRFAFDRLVLGTALVTLALVPAPARAYGFGLFQHGGRGAAQAGALAARADDPAARRLDPAALVEVDGLEWQAGLDFAATDSEFASSLSGLQTSERKIQFTPAVYLGWRPSAEARWALGLSVDSPFWVLNEWPAGFAFGRGIQKSKVALYEFRPAFAWRLAPGWSVGAAVRHVTGKRQEIVVDDFPHPTAAASLPLRADAESSIDGSGFALALRRAAPRWGWAVTAESEVELEGRGDLVFRPDGFSAADVPGFDSLYATRSVTQAFLLPARFTAGVWFALGERSALELDVEHSRWSALERTAVRIDGAGEFAPLAFRRDWDDTLAFRLGGEHRFASGWRLGAGLALEPSPVPDATRELGFPQGDAVVYAVGGGYDLPRISFDFGWSLHDHDDAAAPTTESGIPSPAPRLSASAQAFAVSARWRLGGE